MGKQMKENLVELWTYEIDDQAAVAALFVVVSLISWVFL